jgi:predicted nucleotidyltransferase
MAKTALDTKRHEWHAYHAGAAVRRRQAETECRTLPRWESAQQLAREAARRLRDEFDAHRVVLFGSAARSSSFTLWSDVDLAAWGLAPERFYAAVAAVTGLSTDIAVDLVDPERCPPALQKVIEREGIDL